MDNLQSFVAIVRTRQVFLLLLQSGFLIGGWWVGSEVFNIESTVLLFLLVSGGIVTSIVLAFLSAHFIIKPMRLMWQAVLHIAPNTANTPAPNLRHAPEIVVNLVNHLYQLASVVDDVEKLASKQTHDLKKDFVANSLPLPLVVLDTNQTIVFANSALCDYLHRDASEILQENVYTVLDLSFSSDQTLDTWLADAKTNKAVATASWDRVRLNVQGEKIKPQFDLAAYYNKGNPDGFETMLVFFDHTARYGQDDQNLSFVALAVHELRTPVTLLRGYVEAFEEELADKLDPEMTDFMHKMKASAQQLTTFVNNILDVARIENDQLSLKLLEQPWPEIVTTAAEDMRLRANVQGIELVVEVADNLPKVGVDPVSIYEVISNLIDNAIKYSGQSKKIIIKSYQAGNGMVETTVQDFGVGVASAIMSNLFEKFYRSHHSRTQVKGTGLGLFLCKTIVEAHGGEIWVRSKEGQGSTFGFTVKPYSQLAEAKKNGNNTEDIVHGAHGWIKNHSLYRG